MKQCKYNDKFFNRDLSKESPMALEYLKAIKSRKQYLQDYPFVAEFPNEKLARNYLRDMSFEEVRNGVWEGVCKAYLSKVKNTVVYNNHMKANKNYYLISYI